MTDFLASSQPQIGSEFDVTNLDKSVQSISAVESQWRLPALPDEVKLDLAAFPELNPQQTTEFLVGLERDFFDEDEEFSEVVEEPQQQLFPVFRGAQEPRSGLDNFRTITADVLGQRAPMQPDIDAVAKFKQRAIERGLMEAPPGGQIDNTWDPGMNRVFYDMAFDDYQRRLSGDDSIDSMSTRTAIDMIADWTQPGNLLAAAMDLDLIPDFKAIASETTNWLDKWRKLGDSKNPWDFTKNLLDAALGPVDDIAMPLLTWAAILGTGGSGTLALVPKGFTATRVGRALEGFGSKFAIQAVDDLKRPSALAARLTNSSGGGRRAVGGLMEAWRGFEPVARTKQVLQAPIRLGVLAQAQGALPTLAGDGTSLSDIPGVPGVQEFLRGQSQSFRSLPVELLFAPTNMFSPGTFIGRTGLLNGTVRSLIQDMGPGRRAAITGLLGAGAGAALGDDLEDVAAGAGVGVGTGLILPRAGRALGNSTVASAVTGATLGGVAGASVVGINDVFGDGEGQPGYWDAFLGGAAVGASALSIKSALFRHPGKNRMVGFVSDVAKKSEWKRVANDEAITGMFHEALMSGNQEYRDAFKASDGTFLGAWEKWRGHRDEVTIGGEMMSWITGYTLHRAAKAMAMVDEVDDSPGRYYMMFDKLLGQMRQFNLDDTPQALIEAAARARVRGQEIDDLFGDEYQKVLQHFMANPDEALEMIGHQNRMSRGLMQQLFLMEDAAATYGSDSAAAFLRQMRLDTPAAMDEFVTYVNKNIDSVGDWATYSARMHDIEGVERLGLLDGAALSTYDTPFGPKQIKTDGDARVLISKAAREMDRVATGALVGPGGQDLIASRYLAPLGNNKPTGRFVWAKKTTKSAQELASRRSELNNFRALYKALDATSEFRSSGALADAGDVTQMGRKALAGALKSAGLQGDQERAMQRIVAWARANGHSLDDVETALDDATIKVLNDTQWWETAGMHSSVRVSPGGDVPAQMLRAENPTARRQLLDERIKQLGKKERYTAAEVDVRAHIEKLREAGHNTEADRLEVAVNSAEAAGYKLVHGVDFMLPSDLAQMDRFSDLSVRHTNAMTLGNFFKGKLPAVARANQERRQRAAISAALINLGYDAPPESDIVTRVVADLYDISQRAMDEVADTVSSIRQQGIIQRTGTRISSMGTPLRPEDLAGFRNPKRLVDGLLERGYTAEEIKAIRKAVPKFRNAEFQDVGLYAIEAGLRERSQLAGALKMVSKPLVGGSVGFYTGAAAGSATADMDASDTEVRMRQLGFGLLGAVAGGGASMAANRSGVVDKAVDWAELTRYGYLADGLARTRDTLRFSLSPMFDLSRYVEGYMLGQVGGPMRYKADVVDEATGKLIAKAGDRVTLPYNMSPSGLRRRIAKELGGGPEAARQAERRFNQYLDEFRQAARGDFDPQELDSTGRWFAQVGIMGFNPTDWMATAFGELRRAGFKSDEAYHHARAMYTYGTTGRSAAEMSVNFVVFPFSFQKKAFTHIAEWITDDLARSWLLHDGFKAYDALSDRYNLDEVWRDHLPALQQLRRLNMFAYGLSAGQWGGINRRLIEPVVKAGSELSAQLFAPGAYSIGDRIDIPGVVSAAELTELHESLIPAINDINWMIENLHEQTAVVSSGVQGGQWLTSRAQSAKGWDEWNTFRDETQQALQARGFSWADMYNKPYLAAEKAQVEAFRAQLAAKLPSWSEAQVRSVADSAALELERKNRLAAAAANLETAKPEDFQMAEMEALLDGLKTQLGYQGIEVGGRYTWADAPPEVFYAVQDKGREMLAANRDWNRIWEKYYLHDFGVLEARI